MKTFIAVIVCMLFIGCQALDPGPGCNSDSDCKGTRICISQECVEVGPENTQPTPSNTTTQQVKKKSCSEQVTQCNCNATSAYPGAVSQTPECVSGFQEFAACGQCPSGGLAWTTSCKCWL